MTIADDIIKGCGKMNRVCVCGKFKGVRKCGIDYLCSQCKSYAKGYLKGCEEAIRFLMEDEKSVSRLHFKSEINKLKEVGLI
jgi:hypothetical protein